ncbi:MAG: L-seryl-tRNA(Sec) selenium transferase [Myxococcota bacterium]
MTDSAFRALPGVDTLLADAALEDLDLGPEALAEAARAAIADARRRIAAGDTPPPRDAIARDAATRARALTSPTLRPVVNATGIVVHTNLGRAPLEAAAVDAAFGACNLEYDLARGRRGSRRDHAEGLLMALSGAEAALVVNNNAAAVVLMLASLASGREVVISRGELVEIGGSFRIPDIMSTSGAILREVGTTNRTWIRDYEAAIGEETAAILRVHPSNFEVTGFAGRPDSAAVADVAREAGVPFLHDLGSGTFGPLPAPLAGEGDVRAELAAGADVVCFSGDKLLGGPQAGIVVGRRDLVDRMARHPLARAFRADKLALAALEHTLLAYRAGRPDRVPVSRMLNAPLSDLSRRARALADSLEDAPADVEVVPCEDAVGGGSHPGRTLEGRAVALRPHRGSPTRLAERLRAGTPPVVGVLRDGRLHLHVRTVAPERDRDLLHTVLAALDTGAPGEG